MILHDSAPCSCAAACRMLLKEILSSSFRGQLLPQWTLLLVVHTISHVIAVQCFASRLVTSHITARIFFMSNLFLFCNILIVASGYTLLILLYRHSVTTIFNRRVPSTWTQSMPSFCQHLSMLRPLEIIFRYLTRHLRMLPDIIVLGEVRCGTTTLCHQLTNLEQVYIQGPFCLWAHPEMDHKESFYFVGHYLGYVTPLDYRMCFPLKIEKWWYNHKYLLFPWIHKPKKPFLVLDGCAQYLTSPTAAYLIAEAFHQAGESTFPLLVACLRDPISQAISWWRYENNAMIWGKNMGLTEWNQQLRSSFYPPKTIVDAVEFSTSPFVDQLYNDAESLIMSMIRSGSKCITLPPWAMTWPAGQMSVFGRSSKYMRNLQRYERVFGSYRKICIDSSITLNTEYQHHSSSELYLHLRYTLVVPTQSLSEKKLIHALAEILLRVSKNKAGYERNRLLGISKCLKVTNLDVRRNTTALSKELKELRHVDENERNMLDLLLYKDVDEFNSIICLLNEKRYDR